MFRGSCRLPSDTIVNKERIAAKFVSRHIRISWNNCYVTFDSELDLIGSVVGVGEVVDGEKLSTTTVLKIPAKRDTF